MRDQVSLALSPPANMHPGAAIGAGGDGRGWCQVLLRGIPLRETLLFSLSEPPVNLLSCVYACDSSGVSVTQDFLI